VENNSFLEAIQNGIPDEVDDNPYENAIKEQQKSEIYSASESAAKKNPDQHGKVTSLAQALGVKSDFAEQNYDSLMKRREAALLKQKLDDNKLDKPKTVEYVSDPDNLALTKDELDKYFKLEDKVQETSTWSDLGKGLMAGVVRDIGSNLLKSPSYIAGALSEFGRQAEIQRMKDLGFEFEDPTGKSQTDKNSVFFAGREEDFGFNPTKVAEATKVFRDNPLTRSLDTYAKTLTESAPTLSKDFIAEAQNGNIAEAGRILFVQAASQAPMTVGLALAYATGYGAVGFAGAGVTTASGDFAEAMEKGKNADAALAQATISGTAETVFESMTNVKAFKLMENSVKKIVGEKTAKQIIISGLGSLGIGAGIEGLGEGLTTVAQQSGKVVTGIDENALDDIGKQFLTSASIGTVMGGGITGPVAVADAVRKMSQVKEMKADQQMYQALENNAVDSNLKKRSPEKYKELVEQMTKDGSIESIYINQDGFKSYAQSMNKTPEQLALEMGINQEFSKASESESGVIEVKTSIMADKVAGTEYYQGIKNDVKFKVDGMTPNEMKEQIEQDKADVEAEYNKAKEGKSDEEIATVESSAKEVLKSVEEQLRNGGMSPKEAKNNAIVFSKQLEMLGYKTGQMPADIYKEYGVKINFFNSKADMPNIDIATIYNQGANEVLTTEVQEDESVTFKSLDGKSSMNMRLSRGMDGTAVVDVNQFNYDPELTSNTAALLETAEKLAVDNGSPLVVFNSKSFGKNKTQAIKMLEFHGYRAVKRLGKLFMQKAVGGAKELYQKKVSEAGIDFTAKNGEQYKIFIDNTLTEDSIAEGKKRVAIKNASGKLVGSMVYQVKESEIEPIGITLNKNAQRVGIGTAVYDYVESLEGKQITAGKEQTDAGNAFRKSRDGKNLRQDIRGQIRFGNNRQFNIDLFKTRDESTFLHESAHFFFEVYGDFAEAKNAPQSIKDDYQKMLAHVGVKSRSEVGTDQHEIFARSFEAYMMEGKSPSEALKKVFHTFKNWLISVYRQASGLNVEMTDEIRGVFDRMLATEEEINLAKSNLGVASIFQGDPRRAGLSEQETFDYLTAAAFANMDAKDELRAKVMKDLIRTKDQAYKNKYDEIYAAEIEKAQAMPEFKAMAAIKGELKLSKEIIDQQFSEFKKTIPRGSSVKGEGVHPDVVATMFGYANGQEMLSAMAPYAKGIDSYVEGRAAEEIKKTYPELLESPELSEEAMRALHNENYRKLKRMELKHLATNDPQVLKTVASKLIRRMPSDKAVKEQAVKLIAATNVRDIKPHIYRNSEKKFSIQAAKFYKQGEFEKAFEAKRKEYLNFELYLQAMDAKEDVKKSLDKFKKMFRKDEDIAKSRDVDLVNAAKAILAEFGIVRADKTAEEYLKSMKQYDPETYSMVKALYDSATAQKGNYENVTYDVFVEMRDSVDALYDLAKSRREIQIDGKKMSLDKVKEELLTQVDAITPDVKTQYEETVTKMGKIKMILLGARASLTRVESWAKAMDVQDNGPFHKYIWQPVSDATAKYRLQKNEVLKKYKDLLDGYRSNLTNDKIVADDLEFNFQNKAELMMAVLHSGNESNLRKLLLGRKWGEQNADGTLNTENWDRFIKRMVQQKVLTKADFQFAQNVWDLLESLKPESQKAHKEMFGYYFNEITAKELEVDFGEGPVKFRGGYVPAKADPYTNEDAKVRQEREQFENNNNSFQFPTTGKGFTKSRVESYTVPLSLDMNLLGGHIDGVLRFTYIEPRVKEVSRIALDPGFRQSVSKIDTQIASEMLVPWLQRAAQQQTILPSATGLGKATDAAARVLRRNVAMQIMMGNVTNTLQQVTGLVVAMSKVQPKYIRNAMAEYTVNNKAMIEAIMEKSDWMKSTQGSNIFEIHQQVKEILVNPTTFEKAKEFSSRHAYFLQMHAQNMVNAIVWRGAYDQAIEQKMTDLEAVRMADSAVRTTQGTTNPEDVSRFETGTPTEMMFKQFVSYFNMLANLNGSEIQRIQRDVGLRKGMGRGFYLYLTAFMLPAVLSEIIVRAMGNSWDDDDDNEYLDDAMKVFFGSQFKTATATVPYVGQLGVAAYNKAFTKNIADDRLSLSPVLSIVEAGAGVPAAIYKDAVDRGELKKKTIKDSLQMIGIMTGLPTGPLGRPVGYLMDVESGKAEPTGPIDFSRGLITGKAGN